MRYLFLVMAFIATPFSLFGQDQTSENLFTLRTAPLNEPVEETSLRWRIDTAALRSLLFAAPHERDVRALNSTSRLIVPTPDVGQTARFRIVRYDLAADTDQGRFAHIRTWYGINEEHPEQTIYLDWTERGFHAAVRGGGEAYFIDPLSTDTQVDYLLYRNRQVPAEETAFVCASEDHPEPAPAEVAEQAEGDCVLRQYRVAVTAAVPYCNYHGATSSEQAGLVHSAIVTTLNRVNQVFTQDLSLRLQLIPNNDTLYFYGAADDPFTSNGVGVLINENIQLQQERIGDANFDIGHVFTQGNNNGRGFLRSVCDPDLKGGGVTSLIRPEGDPFNIDYVAHEFGHQLGANHTQNNACNYSSVSGMEPGSGSTIMGYAGICFPDVQGNSDAYFHGRSIEEISAHTENFFTGARCATIIDNSLTNPRVVPVSDHTIPPGTPFKLTGEASGEGLITYNWEQYDAEQSVMPPADTSREGPLFRSFPPLMTGERFFPRFPGVVNNLTTVWEVLPAVAREMNFRLTVRNANASYGCAAEEDLKVTVAGEAPFSVTDPTAGNQWSVGQRAQVQWNVVGTDAEAYRVSRVDILLSVDGGDHFEPLALGVPNTGVAEVVVPDSISSRSRVLVRSIGNVFYNLSERDFAIVDSVGTPQVELTAASPLSVGDCFSINGSVSYSFLTKSIGGASDSLEFTVTGLPAGVLAEIIPAYPRPGGRFEVVLSGINELGQGDYTATITSDGPYGLLQETVNFTKYSEEPQAGPDGMSPAGFSADIRPMLLAEDNGADRYQIQVATTAEFTELLYDRSSTQPNYRIPTYLEGNTTYFWRIRSLQEAGGCGISLWNETSFVTGDCPVTFSTADPVTISTGAPVQIAEMQLEVRENGILEDLDLVLLDIEHSYLNDLQIELESPSGSILPLFNRSCGGNDNIQINFDDEAIRPTFPCPPVAPTIFVRTSELPLSIFDGEEVSGNWTLRVSDLANQDGGQINGFGLKTCFAGATLPVTFSSFTATSRKNDILLAWYTSEETNNRGFYVERTEVLTPTNWSTLGFVAAGQTYQYLDETPVPETDYFYRLRQVDLDGRVAYSPIRVARIDGRALADLQLFPNPTGERLHYRWAVPGADRALRPYVLTDVHGRIVRQGQLEPTGGSISFTSLDQGIYVLRAEGLPAQKVVRQ